VCPDCEAVEAVLQTVEMLEVLRRPVGVPLGQQVVSLDTLGDDLYLDDEAPATISTAPGTKKTAEKPPAKKKPAAQSRKLKLEKATPPKVPKVRGKPTFRCTEENCIFVAKMSVHLLQHLEEAHSTYVTWPCPSLACKFEGIKKGALLEHWMTCKFKK